LARDKMIRISARPGRHESFWACESEEKHFEGTARGDESWFQCSYPSSKMFARSPTDVTPRMRQATGAQKTMITMFVTGCQLVALEILPKGSKFNQLYFVDHFFPDLQRENVNFHRQISQATFLVHTDNSVCHNGSKVASKFENYHVPRLSHAFYSPDISPCGFWLFGMLQRVLKDREFNSIDEIEEAITKVRNKLTFGEIQSVFHNCMSRLAWVTENGESILFNVFLADSESQNRRAAGTFRYTLPVHEFARFFE
jgi:hypothetical protein